MIPDLSWGIASKAAETTEADHTVQGSEAWHKWRGKGIGSSDAAVLLGWSPWKTIDQLWKEKLGLWKPEFQPFQKKAMQRGKELEPKIRFWYEQNWAHGERFQEDVAEDKANPHYRASFDGINRRFKNREDGSIGRIIEIKAPNAKDHAGAVMGEVPAKYEAQIQWLMLVGNIQWSDYVSFGSDGTYAVVPVKADPFIQKELMIRADLFWKHVQTKTPIIQWDPFVRGLSEPIDLTQTPPIQSEKKEVVQMELIPHEESPQITDQAIEAIVAEALTLQQEADQAQARFEAKKEQLKKILGEEKEMRRGEAVFGWQARKGTVDYSVIPELIGIDLEQFRKPPTRAFYFKRVAEK